MTKLKTVEVAKCKTCGMVTRILYAYDKTRKQYLPLDIVPSVHFHIKQEKASDKINDQV